MLRLLEERLEATVPGPGAWQARPDGTVAPAVVAIGGAGRSG